MEFRFKEASEMTFEVKNRWKSTFLGCKKASVDFWQFLRNFDKFHEISKLRFLIADILTKNFVDFSPESEKIKSVKSMWISTSKFYVTISFLAKMIKNQNRVFFDLLKVLKSIRIWLGAKKNLKKRRKSENRDFVIFVMASSSGSFLSI